MIEGRCFCGAIQFELSAEPTDANHCHCISCQRSSGAPFVTWVNFPLASFRLKQGLIAERESSPGVTRGHCAACGTPISWRSTKYPDDIDLTASCFEDASFVKPGRHIWVSHSPAWVVVDDDLPKYTEWSE